MKFYSEFSLKQKILLAIVICIIVVSTIPIFYNQDLTQDLLPKIIISIINLATLGLLYWIITGTSYQIKGEILLCKSGPFSKKININKIRKLEFHHGIVVPCTWKLSLSDKGIIIHYNQYDDIYISPNNSELFITELLKLNPNIILPSNA